MNTASTLVLRPRMSEKAYQASQASGVYVFAVPPKTTKQSVAAAVASQFNVTVEGVRIAQIQGKAKRTVMKRSRPIAGRQNNVRKAYVTLKKGDTIPVFAAVEEAEKQVSEAAAKKGKK